MDRTVWRTWYRRTGERQLRAVVLEAWDPIGVGEDSPTEYDSYLGRIAGVLRRGGTVEDVLSLLRSIAIYEMGMPWPERDRKAAGAIHAWYVEAMRDAEAVLETFRQRPPADPFLDASTVPARTPDQVWSEQAIRDGVVALLGGAPLEDVLRSSLPNALGSFFERLLQETATWSRSWWVDTAIPSRADITDDGTLALTGTFVLADEHENWLQPFEALLRLDATQARLAAYRIRLCEADTRMDAVPWGGPRPKHWPHAKAWSFEFGSG